MFNIKEVSSKPRLWSLSTHYLEYGRHVARLHRRRRRAYAPTSNTASHDNYEKINSCVSFCFPYMRCLWGFPWRPFGPPVLRFYTSDSLWKIRLVESIISIPSSLWTWHDNAISAADIAFIKSSLTSDYLLSPLERSPQKQNDWTLSSCFWGWIMWKMYNKPIIEFGFRMISWMIKTSCLCYLPQPLGNLGFDHSWYHAQPHPIIV